MSSAYKYFSPGAVSTAAVVGGAHQKIGQAGRISARVNAGLVGLLIVLILL